jgi:hypothetical protein
VKLVGVPVDQVAASKKGGADVRRDPYMSGD